MCVIYNRFEITTCAAINCSFTIKFMPISFLLSKYCILVERGVKEWERYFKCYPGTTKKSFQKKKGGDFSLFWAIPFPKRPVISNT